MASVIDVKFEHYHPPNTFGIQDAAPRRSCLTAPGLSPRAPSNSQRYTTARSDEKGERYEPRFTFHGFRYAEIEGWLRDLDLESIEAVVCHTDMKPAGNFECSEPLLNQLYKNIVWGMRGNFFSVPTDCPQRDEWLGYSGDLALFASTATLLYDCFGILKNWLIDVKYDQMVLDGVPPIVSPNACLPDPKWCRRHACAIWHDVTILAPWELYMETGDESILAQQYNSMMTWMEVSPRDVNGAKYLWDPTVPRQLGDWLDPATPSDAPWKASTDVRMVCNMFLIHSLDLMARITLLLGQHSESTRFKLEAECARSQFQDEYVTRNGRIISNSQAAHALAICFGLLTPAQKPRTGARLAELVQKNDFKIGTGFAGTPYLCEALVLSGYPQVAYSMLLNKECPSWLYPVTRGATTVWERWDSMLPDGSINPGEMTSFNHYAFGAIGKFMYERLAGLQRVKPGWKKCRVAPTMGAEFSEASASHVTPYGELSCSWRTSKPQGSSGKETFKIHVKVPINVTVEVVIPESDGERREVVVAGELELESTFERNYTWPVEPLDPTE
ncbi:hypothetical protein NW762_012586 [Fusarium torreyae]|uniref:alpha-L-rhamnosidase n=1 Tax=Fusarium torreyae TaxID=1237075 RepID=A0A9W8RRD8_9HYPO|nr:hypothetical protein NW762_012586 [Fusarium torreyae]